MFTQDILTHIPVKGIPLFLYDRPKTNFEYFCCQLQTSKELAILRNSKKCVEEEMKEDNLGVYLLNADVEFIYNQSIQKNIVAVDYICSNLLKQYHIQKEDCAIAYTLFSILHEFGHWNHYISSHLSRMEYWKMFELDRDCLWMEFQLHYNFYCHTDEEKRQSLFHFHTKYCELPTEKLANQYAFDEFPKYYENCLIVK